MTPEKFLALWENNKLTERAGAQAHFNDLCDLLGVEKPRDPDNYCFERGAAKSGGGNGWADVWKRGHFGWENKKPGRDLDAALKQLTDYALKLDNPPLLVVCDRKRIIIHTAFSGYPDEPREICIEDIGKPENLQILQWVFTDPEKLRPVKSNAAITADAAGHFADLAAGMRQRGLPAQQVAHFLTQCLFCMFVEDQGLLPKAVFSNLLEKAASDTRRAANRIESLFAAMRSGGDYGDDAISHFNGGLFKVIEVPALEKNELAALALASRMDWRAIDPAIFGTLFERGLDPKQRAQLGANYTDPQTIMKLINPVINAPLLAEWEAAKAVIAAKMATFASAKKGAKAGTTALQAAKDTFLGFLERLRNFRVLDPACGSGNFLYLALKTLKDIEHRANIEAEELGLQRQVSIEVSPANVLGLELDPYAAELARVTVWIGEIQWMMKGGYPVSDKPILKPLHTIENRDALINGDDSETAWPSCDVIVGNPPFLGDKVMRSEMGDVYVNRLRKCFDGRVAGGADLVTYWFEKARAQIEAKNCKLAGLVSTNSIRQKRNRVVLERILKSTPIFEAWSDQPWINDGAAVRVSLVCFGQGQGANLDGKAVGSIHADLSGSADAASTMDLTTAKPLFSNKGSSFFGLCLAGPFKVDTATALKWLKSTGNTNGRPNSDVVRPIYNGSDVTGRWAGNWTVDFSAKESEEAADYLSPFAHVETHVKPVRQSNREATRAEKWWRHGRRRPELRAALKGLTHYIATSETAKHRFFVKLPLEVAPEHKLVVFPRDDDVMFGLLSSRIHVVWAMAKGGHLGVGNDSVYTSSLTFETFPFPPGFDLKAKAAPDTETFKAIAAAAANLQQWRENWLNPEGWVMWEQSDEEKAAGFPPRPIPVAAYAAEWKKRTLTALYNQNPGGLTLRQEKLDAAVASAYGWADYTSATPDEKILKRLLTLNLENSGSTAVSAVPAKTQKQTRKPKK